MSNILVIDDDEAIRDYLKAELAEQGFGVETLSGGHSILDYLRAQRPDLVLLDQNMPGVSGLEVVQQIRSSTEYHLLPVIFITGNDGEDYKVQALEAGADDYVVKPISPKEIGARIRAVLRRSAPSEGAFSDRQVKASGITINLKAHQAFVDKVEVFLTLTEFKILFELMRNSGQVLSRDVLRSSALGNLNVTDRTIDVHVAALRKKLKPYSKSIQTVRGVGYRFFEARSANAS